MLYTLLDEELIERLEKKCAELSLPCRSILGPVLRVFQSYLGASSTPRVGAQHTLNAEYFKRIDALNYTMLHDDGQHIDDLEQADVVLVGVSRTSKTPTSIYLANRGVKTGNYPLVPGVPVPPQLEALTKPLVVGLFASPERIVQIRQNRLLGLRAHHDSDSYIDKQSVADEINFSRKLCARHNWPLIDVSRRSIEETAAAVLQLLSEKRRAPVSVMSFWSAPAPLVLASKSFARRNMLSAAGIPIEIIAAAIDERAIERTLGIDRDPDELALLLSWEKASAVSHKAASRLVVGADQTLALGRGASPSPPIATRRASNCRCCAAIPIRCIRR